MQVGVVRGQGQGVPVPLHGRLDVALLLGALGRRDVGLGEVVDRHAAVGLGGLGGLQDAGQEFDRLLRLPPVVMVQARLQLVVAEQVADRLEKPHQCAFLPIFFGGCVRMRNRLRAWRRTSSGMFLSPQTIFRSRLPRRGRNWMVSPGGVFGLRTRACTVEYALVQSLRAAMDRRMSSVTFRMFAKVVISLSDSFGLFRTWPATILAVSRIRMARSSALPFMASCTRS